MAKGTPTSDLIFEKVLDLDGSITTDPIVAFLEQNQNFYYINLLSTLFVIHQDFYKHRKESLLHSLMNGSFLYLLLSICCQKKLLK